MGLCSSADAAPPSFEEGEVEAGAEDIHNDEKSEARQARKAVEAEEEDFGGSDDMDLEELGLDANTFSRLQDVLNEKQQKQLTARIASHFKDNDALHEHDLSTLFGFKRQSTEEETEQEAAAATPLFLKQLHNALRQLAKKKSSSSVEDDTTTSTSRGMGITEAVEVLLHIYEHMSTAEQQSNFLYDHVYRQSNETEKGNAAAVSANDIQLSDTHAMATSMLESAVDMAEFHKEIQRLGLLNVQTGELESDVRKIMTEYLTEELGSNGGDTSVTRERFQQWVEKCRAV